VQQIASDLLVERLADWGVDTVFGLPGDGINGIMEGFRRHQASGAVAGALAALELTEAAHG
jgi:thiamine pyrophosphate-dependent acetolactate synthase large subunit-like protein